jgi:hypothetical protein
MRRYVFYGLFMTGSGRLTSKDGTGIIIFILFNNKDMIMINYPSRYTILFSLILIKMVRWQVVEKKAGITSIMKTNILGAIDTAIGIYGVSERYKIVNDVKYWLERTYGKRWTVLIGDTGSYQLSASQYDSKFLRVKETHLKWTIDIYQQIP